ncbi:HypC/HybG/HupF family hydrogenase formation chaperone [Marinobacterium marinum]|uniref:HypC/HybG/HupF family hydrogenase formation chaperone n=1 Tax=Marinobacterium marinum TaxID=2756129 RepID=A0A7W1WX66_9GAMM|nr:HypC/HybG/HupF family hydrogenase formation chaperone [Marinobacterium marinum]MBA4501787.1 HypC/HybG/HupF family hydrogenase formation chaperone [Marinobacterium marinum]
MCLGVPGEIVAIDSAATASAVVEISGVRRRVNLTCVLTDNIRPESLLGQWVLVHTGFAMSLIDAAEAQHTLTLLAELEAFSVDQEAAP